MKKNLPILFLIIFNLAIGLLISDNYGESWDENNMRSYGELTLPAYRNFFQPERMADFYEDLDDRQYYGPVYMMVCTLIVDFLNHFFTIELNTTFHFLNFAIYVLGVYFFYSISKRFFPTPVAIANTILFNFQPILWGHAFINPKDIPIMVFFMGAIEIGLRMVDSIPKLKPNGSSYRQPSPTWEVYQSVLKREIIARKTSFSLAIAACLVFYLFDFLNVFRSIIFSLLTFSYKSPKSLPGLIFYSLAQNYQTIPLEMYVNKGVAIINTINLIVIALILIIPIIQVIRVVFFDQLNRVISLAETWILAGRNSIRSCFFSTQPWREAAYTIIETGKHWQFWTAAGLLGILSSIRLNGPYVGVLIAVLIFTKNRRKAVPVTIIYGGISILVMYVLWPYLWSAPFQKFLEAIKYMTNFPWNETVLFDGARYKANHLPADYLPRLLLAQFTEPYLLVIFTGLIVAATRFLKKQYYPLAWFLFIFWFTIPFSTIILSQMRIYDNFRHIFFILPPLLLFAGFTLDALYKCLKKPVFILLTLAILAPGILSNFQMHPYEYVYYNSTVGGLEGAKNKYELDYLGTSIKEATQYINEIAPSGAVVYIYAPTHLVYSYARFDLDLTNNTNFKKNNPKGFTINLNRFYWNKNIFPGDEDVFQVKRGNAVFTTVRKVK